MFQIVGGLHGEGWPYFNSEEGCAYVFDWETKYACIDHPLSATCSVQDESKTYDLTPLIKTTGKLLTVFRVKSHLNQSVIVKLNDVLI